MQGEHKVKGNGGDLEGRVKEAGGAGRLGWMLARRLLQKNTRSDKIAGHQSREENPQTRPKFAGIGRHVDSTARGWHESGPYSKLYPD